MKVLIAEDDITSRTVLKHMLTTWGYEVVVTNDGNEAWQALQAKDAPRLAILDWMMPGIDGVEVCRRVREIEKDREEYTYALLLTAKATKENIVVGMESGADDYIVKPFDRHELRVRVRSGQRIIDLQSELLEAKQELIVLSRTDPLTGIFNRRTILAEIENEISRAGRENRVLSLSMLDIDFFKKVNDTYGHPAGDEVLRECVRRADSVMRGHDCMGRYGGEEFLLMITGAEKEGACAVGERVRSVIEASDMEFEGKQIHVTVSQGVATWDGRASMNDVIARADKALYRAKENGRNRVECAEED